VNDQTSSNFDWDCDHSENDSEMELEDINFAENKKSSNNPCSNDLQILFNASMLIKHKIKSKPVFEIPWPRLAADITNEKAIC
jgi:hypothetical protein